MVLNYSVAPSRRAGDTALDVAVCTDDAAFAALEPDWDDLHDAASDATPFQSWAWLYSWWETTDRTGLRLRVVTLRDPRTGLLVGVVPLMLARRYRLWTLLFLVDSEQQDVLVRDGWELAVQRELGRALARMTDFRVADLGELEPHARLWSALGDWSGPQQRRVVFRTWHVPVATEEDVLAGLSRNRRATLRKSLRRAESLDMHPRPAATDRLAEATTRLVELHRDVWADREIARSHTTDRYERFLRTAVPRLAARGLAEIVEWWRDGDVEISQLLLYRRDVAQAYQEGATRQARAQLQWGSLCIWASLAAARDRGCSWLDLSPGEEPHKQSWNPAAVEHHRLRLGRGAVGGRLALRYLGLRGAR